MTNDVEKITLTIPEEENKLVKILDDDLTGIATINSALVNFEPKKVFAWHFTLLIEIQDHGEDGIPSAEEQKILQDFELELDPEIKANGNAIFLARVTNDGLRELIYRVHQPEPLDNYMKKVIESGKNARPFDYRIDPDQSWEKAQWYFKALK